MSHDLLPGEVGHRGLTTGVDTDFVEEPDGIDPVDQYFGTGTQGLIARDNARQGFMAREQEYPDLGIPSPEEVLGEICPVCKGTTWVVRANAELEGPVMAQLDHCDNRDCPQMAALGLREIVHLAVPYNRFDDVVQLGKTGQITALVKSK